jgi:hypothetical protein
MAASTRKYRPPGEHAMALSERFTRDAKNTEQFFLWVQEHNPKDLPYAAFLVGLEKLAAKFMASTPQLDHTGWTPIRYAVDYVGSYK